MSYFFRSIVIQNIRLNYYTILFSYFNDQKLRKKMREKFLDDVTCLLFYSITGGGVGCNFIFTSK